MTAKIGLITQARISSSRLPAKVLMPLASATVLDLHLKRLSRVTRANVFCVATTLEPDSSKIIDIAEHHGWSAFQGSTDDVLDRFYQAAKFNKLDIVIRLTSDCPLIDPGLVDDLIQKFTQGSYDYGSNCLVPTLPDGQSAEIFTFSALEKSWRNATLTSEREHVTPYLWKNSDVKGGHLFKALALRFDKDLSDFRMTLDHPDDLKVISELVRICGEDADLATYVQTLFDNQQLRAVNSRYARNEGYNKSLRAD